MHPDEDGGKVIAELLFHAITGAPVFKSEHDIFLDNLLVSLVPTGANLIYYTLDGSEPTKSSLLYKKPIKLTATTTIKATAIGEKISPVISATYTKVTLHDGVKIEKTFPRLAYDYFEAPGTERNLRALKLEAFKVVNSSTVATFSLAVARRKNEYGIKYTGLINIKKDGIYTFHITSDDGSMLTLDGKEVIDNGGQHGTIEMAGEVALKAGLHPITVKYFDCGGGTFLKVEYECADVANRMEIPAAVLCHARVDARYYRSRAADSAEAVMSFFHLSFEEAAALGNFFYSLVSDRGGFENSCINAGTGTECE